MNCFEKENVCSVKKEDNSGYYRLHTIWNRNGFLINLTSRDGAWRGEMKDDDARRLSEELGLEKAEYLKECKKALTTHEGLDGMVYAVENGEFTWKKVIDEDSGIKLKMGSLILRPTPFVDAIQNMVQLALDCNQKLREEITELREKTDALREERNSLLGKMDEIIKSKEQMESDLFERFLILLNSKKEKIKELEKKLKSDEPETNEIFQEEIENPYEVETDEDGDDDDDDDDMRHDVMTQTPNPDETKMDKRLKEVDPGLSIKDSSNTFGSDDGDDGDDGDGNEKTKNKKEDDVCIPSTKEDLLEYFYGS